MKRSVFFLDQGEFLGGAERFLLDFFSTLNTHDLEQINPIVIGGQSPAYRDRIKHLNIIDFTYPSVRGGRVKKIFALFRLVLAAWKLKKLFPKDRDFVIFSNSPRTHFAMYLARTLFRVKGQWICMFHDFTIPDFLLKKICRSTDVLIANGEPMKTYLEKKLPTKDYQKTKEIYNGINFAKIPPARVPNGLRKILVIGRIDPRKGQIYALQAADIVHQKYLHIEFAFVGSPVAGDSRTQAYDKKLREYRRINNMENIKFIPEVKDPFKTISEYDAVLFTPTEPETFGRVVIEALALGKLVIAFDETGPREILNAYINFLGVHSNLLLVPQKDTGVLAERINYFVKNFSEAKPFMERGREFVESRYSLEETKQKILQQLYRE